MGEGSERKSKVGAGSGGEKEENKCQPCSCPGNSIYSSEEPVRGHGDDNSAHCEGRQESSGQNSAVQRLGPVVLLGPRDNVLLSIYGRFLQFGFEFGFVVLHSLLLQKLQGGEIVSVAGAGQAHLLVFRQGARLGIGQQGRLGPWR